MVDVNRDDENLCLYYRMMLKMMSRYCLMVDVNRMMETVLILPDDIGISCY